LATTERVAADRLYPTTSHWGAFSVRVHDGEIAEVVPHASDPSPSPLLGNLAGALRHPTRVARPAVRRGWLERGPGPTGARGREEFVELPWDEVSDLVAGELRRVRDQFGNSAMFGGSYGWASAGRFHHAQGQLHRFLNGFGGFTSSVNSYSLGTSLVLLPHVVGSAEVVLRRASTWPTIIDNTELIVAFGGIPAKNVYVTPGGVTRHTTPDFLTAAAERGVRVALVSPLREDLPDAIAATWFPIVPGTDVALMLALSHTLLVEGLADLEFIERYTSGFQPFADYVLGRVDGVPKDARWAAAITEIDAADIVALARRMATSRTLVTVTWSLQRSDHGEQPVWAGLVLAALLGQIGLPGGGFGHGYGSMADVGDVGPLLRLPSFPQGRNPVRDFIPVARVADMLLHPGELFEYNGSSYTYPDIRLVYWAGGNPFHHHQDLNRLRRALARPDTIIVHEPHWTSMARHADIVLPTTTFLEREDFGGGRRDTHFLAMYRAVEPIGDARDDYVILAALAERLGFADAFTQQRSPRQWLEHLYERWRAGLRDNEVVAPPFEQFWAAGGIELPAGDTHETLFERFRKDPSAERLHTPSGRIEISSEVIASYGYAECPGHPVWLEPRAWSTERERFPLHLIANQPSTRLHSQLDVGAVSQASKVHGREALRMHRADAEQRGIRDGDVVRVHNERGACLAGVVVTDAIRPGVVQLPTGAWYDPLDDHPRGPLCVHGNPNVLTADIGTSRLSQGCSGQQTFVEVERFDDPLPPLTVLTPPTLISGPRPRWEGVSERR
jgi:biotin/methionine sulfoxide reductase